MKNIDDYSPTDIIANSVVYMDMRPTRKRNRAEQYDYSTAGAYFITACTANKEKILWENVVGADSIRPPSVS